MENKYRPETKDIPVRMATPPTLRGYPVPWFLAEVDGAYDVRAGKTSSTPFDTSLLQKFTG